MMHKLLYLFLAIIAFTFTSCGEDDPIENATSSAVQINFVGKMDGQELELESKTYQAASLAEGFRLTRASFYLSDIVLLQEGPSGILGTEISEVAYFQLTPNGLASDTFDDIPVGSYTGIRFNVGLTAELDGTTPADYASTHPLGRPAEYWFDWESYIFLKLEGRSDTLADNSPMFNTSFTYHIGKSENLARSVQLNKAFEVEANATNPMPINLQVDIAKLLNLDTQDPLSLVGVADHQNGLAPTIMNRAEDAFTLDD